MTIRYAAIWNDQRRRAAPIEGSTSKRVAIPMENAPVPAKKRKGASGNGRKVCSGEQLAALLDTHRWSQRKPKK
jgi:hypothetical protein